MTKRTAFVNARLLDPASGLDARGGLLAEEGVIADLGPGVTEAAVGPDTPVVDCGGACLAPGLIDMRVHLGEPGEEHKETIDSASRAAAAGGVTTMVALPNTNPVIDDVNVIEFIARRAREVRSAKVFAYGAVTRGLGGKSLTELGLLKRCGGAGLHGRNPHGCELPRHAPCAQLRAHLRRTDHPAPRGSRARPRRLRDRGGDLREARPSGDPLRRRGDAHRARSASGRDNRRALPRGACDDGRGARTDLRGEAGWIAGHLRHRPPLFCAQRDGHRRLPHLRQGVAAPAGRNRPARGRRRTFGRHHRCDRERPFAP